MCKIYESRIAHTHTTLKASFQQNHSWPVKQREITQNGKNNTREYNKVVGHSTYLIIKCKNGDKTRESITT